ncbi:MAG: rhodanese-like domain-containing protein, partial [Rhodospirillales bacterium]
MSDATVRKINALSLKEMLHDGAEIAILDTREEGIFSERHLLLASSLPLSHVETRVATLVPRRSTRIIVCDSGEGQAVRAAMRLEELGYTDVSVLEGGIHAWGVEGFELYSGVNVPSKAFGEFIEHEENTPRMTALEINDLRGKGADLIILDSRPIDEFQRMSIPGAIDCPGAELAFRVHGLVPSKNTLVVVNCAGRTRSIIGAQSLINAGIPNKVVALKDGTMGWHLAGLELEHGQNRCAPTPKGEALKRAKIGSE